MILCVRWSRFIGEGTLVVIVRTAGFHQRA